MTAFDFNAPVAYDIQESRDRWEKFMNKFMNDVETNVCDWSGASLHNAIVPSSVQFEKITFTESNGTPAVEINFNTGEINLADHMLLDDAARLFWDRVMQLNPYSKQEVAVHYSPESCTEQFGFFMTSKGEKMAWWETPGNGMDIGDAPVRKLDEPTPPPVEQFEFFTVSLVDDYESKYNRAMKVVK